MSDDRLTDAIQGFFSELANLVGGQARRLDPDLERRLETLGPKTIEVQSTEPGLAWSVTIEDGNVRTSPGSSTAPHAIVKGSAAELLTWLFGGTANIEIEGDVTLVDEFVSVCKAFSPQMGEPFESAFGSDFVQSVLGAAEVGINTLTSILEGLGSAARDRAHDTWVNESQFDEFLADVDDLRLRVDRLAAKVEAREAAGKAGKNEREKGNHR